MAKRRAKRIGRCYAAGVDVSGERLYAVVLGIPWYGKPMLCLEHVGSASLPFGSQRDGGVDDPTAVADGISAALGSWAGPSMPGRMLAVGMDIPLSEAFTAPVDPAACVGIARAMAANDAVGHYGIAGRGIEAAMAAEAERLFGIERGELAVDWLSVGIDGGTTDTLLLIAALRRQVDARVEAAEIAGLRSACVEVNVTAAARACRFATTRLFGNDAAAAALYRHREGDSLFTVGRRYRDPDLRRSVSDDALDAMLAQAPAALIVAGDDPGAASSPAARIAGHLGCRVVRFDAGGCCDAAALDDEVGEGRADSACYAAAFGLALRALSS